jgi:hypothetical protein
MADIMPLLLRLPRRSTFAMRSCHPPLSISTVLVLFIAAVLVCGWFVVTKHHSATAVKPTPSPTSSLQRCVYANHHLSLARKRIETVDDTNTRHRLTLLMQAESPVSAEPTNCYRSCPPRKTVEKLPQ